MQKTGIYKLEFIDGSYYIGQSINIESRLKNHYKMLLEGTHHSYKVQHKYNSTNILPKHSIIKECNVSELNSIEDLLIDLSDKLCLNVKAGGDSNFGINAVSAKYHTSDIEMAFLLLVDHPGILHREVAAFVGIDINTVHDISAGRSRALTEMSIKYPEKYAALLKMKAPNTRGKTTVILGHEDGRTVRLITGEYSEFCRNNNVQSSNLAKVITGKRKATMGWKLLEKYENI